MAEKLSAIFDTGPLSVICGFPLNSAPYIHMLLSYSEIFLPEAVVTEIKGAGKLARVVLPLIKSQHVKVLKSQEHPAILDTAYSRGLGSGERGTIKSALAAHIPVILDDREAFVVACRFGLRPLGFQDFIVKLVHEVGLPRSTGKEIVINSARQFPASYLTHTLYLLDQEITDGDPA